jgi:hypothetical protein
VAIPSQSASTPFVYHTNDEVQQVVESNQLTRRRFLKDRQKLKGNCYAGQLTSLGLQQMKELGQLLRIRYVEQLNFLPPKFDQSLVFFRSTAANRTFESAQSLIWGLYPPTTRPAGPDGIVEIHMIESAMENMYARSACSRISELKKKIKKLSSVYLTHVEQRKQLEQEVQQLLGRDVNSWSALHCTLECLERHGYVLPNGWTQDLVRQVADEASWEMAAKFASQTLCRLSIGRFLNDVLQRMHKVISKEEDVRFVLFSGHDSTLAPFLHAFQVSDGKHPPMSGAIILELYADAKGQHWVRFLYNGKELALHNLQYEEDKKNSESDAQILANADKTLSAFLSGQASASPVEELSVVAAVELETGTATQTRKEVLRLCPFNEFVRISSYLIPRDYEKECAPADD